MNAQQLKNSILQMAVQGKLVPQDPNDEPASVLLERIRAEKEQLIKEGKIKREKNPSVIFRGADNLPYEQIGKNEPVCIADELPFEIPDSWEWVRLSSLVSKEIRRGKSPKYSTIAGILVFAQKCNVKAGGIDLTLAKYLDPSTFERYPAEEYLQDQDIIINSTGNGTLGRIGVFRDADRIDDSVIVPDSHVTIVRLLSSVNKDYLLNVLRYYQPYLEGLGEGSTNQTELKPAIISDLLVPIPPADEQCRIAGKLLAVLPFIGEYGKKETSLDTYNRAFPDQLRKSILQHAVQGKLVPQDPNDEPASVLLERIRTEKEQLVKEGKIKRDKHESVIYRRDNSHYEKVDGIEKCIDDEIPFEIPENWSIARLGSVITLLSGADFSPNGYNDNGNGIPYITGASNILNDAVLVNRWTPQPRVIAHKGDVLLVCKGSGYGKTVICNIDEAHIARQIMAIVRTDNLDMEYIRLFLDSNFDLLKSKGQGVIPGIDRSSVLGLCFPLPPLSEQRRIVDKVRQTLSVLEEL